MPLTHTVSEEVTLDAVDQEVKLGGGLYSSDFLTVSIDGGFTGTVFFENSLDGERWFPFGMFPTDGGGVQGNDVGVTKTSTNGCFVARWCPYWVRFRVQALTAGVVKIRTNQIMHK